ncbi:MAG TPA: hypothetical protein VGD91_28180 [Trebonia sp.]
MRAQASSERGHAAQWTVTVWAIGGSVSNVTVKLKATPASGGAPGFSAGCGADDGTSSCRLDTVDAKSAQHQLQTQLTVPVTATDVNSVTLAVTASTAHLPKDPRVAVAVTVTAPADPTVTPTDPPAVIPPPFTSPLPVGSLPGIPPASTTLSPGGDAAGLFPTLAPQTAPQAAPGSAGRTGTRPVANTFPLPAGVPVLGAQVAGLAALAVAFVLAATRLTIRRKAGSARQPPKAAAAAAAPAAAAEKTPDGQAAENPDPAKDPDDAGPGA